MCFNWIMFPALLAGTSSSLSPRGGGVHAWALPLAEPDKKGRGVKPPVFNQLARSPGRLAAEFIPVICGRDLIAEERGEGFDSNAAPLLCLSLQLELSKYDELCQ